MGDVNCDGEVNIHDVNDLIEILLGHHVVGTHVESADVNNDGQINISDVNTLIDILLNPPVNYTVTLDCDLAEMNVGDTIKLTATIQHAAYLDPSFTWSSTDEAVAVVHDGTVIALAAGECDIIAEFKGNHAACHVVVSEVFPEQVTLSQASATLEVSKQLMLTATVYPSNVSDPTLTWSTSDEAVATVSGTGESGTVTAIAPGECDIVVDCQGIQAACHVEVIAVYPDSVTLDMTSATLEVSTQLLLTAAVYPSNVSDPTLTWSSSDEAVATVSGTRESGTVTAVATGECDIIVDCQGKQATCHIQVEEVLVDSVTLSRASAFMEVSKRLMLTAKVYPSNVTNPAFSWSTTDASVATVRGSGKNASVTAVGLGQCDIIVDCQGKQATCHVEVIKEPLSSLALNHEYVTLNEKETVTLMPILDPATIDLNTVSWSSSDEGVATVDGGEVKAHSPGTSVITATCQGKQATCVIAVLYNINVNGVALTMVPIQSGTFLMGAPLTQAGSMVNEKPQHEVTLSAYMIGQTEVTQELWKAVMGYVPGRFKGFPQHPVENISWEDCVVFIDQLNKITGLNFHLPTEAQWEFAARGGNQSKNYLYSGSDTIDVVAWTAINSASLGEDDPDYGTHDVATKRPNELNLFDMTGNVNEWCQDWWTSYTSEAQTDPTGDPTGIYKVYRGGGWKNYATHSTVSYRYPQTPSFKNDMMGLRLAL